MIGERDDWAPIWISLYKANRSLWSPTARGGCFWPVMQRTSCRSSVCGSEFGFEDADNLAWKLAL